MYSVFNVILIISLYNKKRENKLFAMPFVLYDKTPHKTVIDWFCLINSKGIGPKTFWALLRAYGSAEKSLPHVEAPFPYEKAEKLLKSFKGHVLLASDPIFPKELRRTSSCPPMLFAMGNLSLLNQRKVSVIGARNASINGKSIAKKMGEGLSNYFVVISGLANGIDTNVHLGADKKKSIAVMPFALNCVYPAENSKLFKEISEEGLVISTVPSHRSPDQGMFHARNKIIATLSEGMVVIEASLRSGSIAAAKMALDIGTEVMAVPGSPSDPRSKGCNWLIKNGAPLVEDYTDVLEILGYNFKDSQNSVCFLDDSDNKYDDLSNQIVSMLSSDSPTCLETIATNLNVDIKDILCNISELEIIGKISKCSTNEVILNVQS
jgi:DNA processing protein